MASGHVGDHDNKTQRNEGSSNDTKVMKGRGHTSCLMLIKYFTGFTTEKLSSSQRTFWFFFSFHNTHLVRDGMRENKKIFGEK